ncbi:MAG: 4'-phosphopantetheinyl transferase superfamily protein, partial [Firmicutes bacterium]|nr:4'-phosphopantetheinyl transferase superfamily protein [Bacillota bacterium]
MIVGIGVDTTEIARFAQAIARRPGIVQRLFSDREQESVGSGAESISRWAARFAAKEALIKAC